MHMVEFGPEQSVKNKVLGAYISWLLVFVPSRQESRCRALTRVQPRLLYLYRNSEPTVRLSLPKILPNSTNLSVFGDLVLYSVR
jgi:hypothetical protein